MGYDGVVTGHYARTEIGPHGKTLHRAVDHSKDQSYVLSVLTIEQINGAIFPLGDTTKVDIRAEAERRGLAVAQKPDSHDICFVPSGDNAGWLRDRLGSEVGPIVDQDGNKIGEHQGCIHLHNRPTKRFGTYRSNGRWFSTICFKDRTGYKHCCCWCT
jgi:tRNA-specific 2-thiouridylase